ncbi:MAG: ABC transporter substrate-binding protein [Anaerolineae bacterium]|nr:ABC transporter substrate-binding protein [Gloeobacterales cyanobacterium ES-bin-313]
MGLANNFRFSRRHIVGALTLGSLGLVACGKSSTEASSKAIRVGLVDWVGYSPLYVALAKGIFKELGIDLDAKTFQGNNEEKIAFVGGRLDGAADVLSSGVELANSNKDFRIVMVIDRSVGADGILASNKIADLKGFQGQKVALEEGTVSHYFFLQVLAGVGLTGKDITIINASPGDAAAAYQSRNVDIAVTYAPFLGKANAIRKDGRIIYDSSKNPYAIADIYEFDARFIEEHPDTLQAFVTGFFKGLDYIKAHPEESAEIVAKELKITVAEVTEFLKGVQLADIPTNLDMLTNPASQGYVPKTMATLAQFLLDQGQIKAIPDLAKLIEPKFVLAAQKA